MHDAADLSLELDAVAGCHLLIALSGGCDSAALAVILAENRARYGIELTAAHLDHGIRPESAGDADYCRELCEALRIPLHSIRLDIPSIAAKTGEGLETVARRLRYEWLRKIKTEVGAQWIALAHHMDDQAETVLMHLARGTGPEGIAAMRVFSGDLFRPLLSARKQDLVLFLQRRGICWREDSTNAIDDTPRNALRLRALPALEQCYPQFSRAAARYAQSAAIESDYLAEQARDYLARSRRTGPFGDYLSLSPMPPNALLRRAIRSVCGSELTWEGLNRIAALCAAPRGRLDYSKARLAERCGHGIYFVKKQPPSIAPEAFNLSGVTCLPGLLAVFARPSAAVPIRNDRMRQVLKRSALCGAVLRTRRVGDRIRPLGGGEKKLSDYFTDRKIDRPLRDYIGLLAKGDRVLWVCGLGISQEAALTRDDDEALLLECSYEYPFSMTKPDSMEERENAERY